LFNLDPIDTDHIHRDSGASVDFKDITKFRQLCEQVWAKKFGYLVIDKSKHDLNQKYRFQLDLVGRQPNENQSPHIVKAKPRAIKSCDFCKLDILSSSMARHLKSKYHYKKAS
jgi:hypothetical protein